MRRHRYWARLSASRCEAPARARPGLVLLGFAVLVAGASRCPALALLGPPRLDGRCVRRGPRVAGERTGPRHRGQVLVRDNEDVAAGASLVRLDPRDLEVKVEQGRAALATAQVGCAGPPRPCMIDESTNSQVALAAAVAARAALGIESARRALDERSRLLARRAAVGSAGRSRCVRWTSSARRACAANARALRAPADRPSGVRPRRQRVEGGEAAVEAARQRTDVASAEVAQSEAEVATQGGGAGPVRAAARGEQAALRDARIRRGEVAIRSAEVASAEAEIAEVRAALREAELNRGTRRSPRRSPVGYAADGGGGPGRAAGPAAARRRRCRQRLGDRELQRDPAHPRAGRPARLDLG